MPRQEFPILEFDATKDAVIEPREIVTSVDLPGLAVACFFQEVVACLVKERCLTPVAVQTSEMGQHPIYVIEHKGVELALFHPCVGAPLAAAMLEEVIAHGAKVVLVCGGSGALLPDIPVGRLIIPTSAIRDEGTSYHYLPPSREVSASQRVVRAVERVLDRKDIPYLSGKTWTTDALYRETRAKAAARRAEGCVAVEMEAAALFAVARFRRVELAQVLYAGDSIANAVWEHREWNNQKQIRETLFWLSCDACCELATAPHEEQLQQK